MRSNESILILGAGQAAVQAADTLRRRGFSGRVTLVGSERELPYQRPPLSKKYLAGELARERLFLRPPAFYEQHHIELRLGRLAEEIDRSAQRVRLDDGTQLAYDALLLATGSHPRMLPLMPPALEGVHRLRTVADADALASALQPSRRVVIVGGGYIGLEVAATCRGLGLDVTVLEMADRPLGRVVCPQVSSFFEAEHTRRGVRIVCNARIRAIDHQRGRVRAVLGEDGTEYPADVLLIAIGGVPADELASAAGIECAGGIATDVYCRTSDARVYAAGDCASHMSPRYGRRVRLESVDNAFEQAASAALNLLEVPTVHDRIPWFWSDQYDLKLVIVGLSLGYDTAIVRGQPAARSFTVCYLRGGELIAVDTVNQAKDQMAARRLIAERVRPALDKLQDPHVPLRNCI